MTRFGILAMAAFFLILESHASAEGARTYWTLEDFVLVRTQAKAQAPIKGSLRIGIAFIGVKKEADWIYIEEAHNQRVGGWVQTSMVSESEVNKETLLQEIKWAKSFSDSLKWCERMAAFNPEDKSYLKALQKGYKALGDTARSAEYGRRFRGTNPAYLARYDGKDLLVIGAIDSLGEFQSLLWHESTEGSDKPRYAPRNDSCKAIRKRALGLLKSLGTQVWYSAHVGVSHMLVPLVFISWPKVVPQIGKMEGYITDLEGTATFGISIGSSSEVHGYTSEEGLFATRPITLVPVSGIKKASEFDSLAWYRKKLVGNAFDSVGVHEVKYNSLDEYGYVDVQVGGFLADPVRSTAVQRGIFNSRRVLVWPPEYVSGTELHTKQFTPTAVPRWFRFGPDAGSPAFIVLPFTSNISPPEFREGNGDYGYNLLKVSKTGFKAYHVRSDYGGD